MRNKGALIIGSGAISSLILDAAKSANYLCDVIPLRKLRKQLPLLELDKYSLFIYLGYDHFSLYRNVNYMKLVTRILTNSDCKGVFVFLNTQGALLNFMARDSLPAYDACIPDRYLISKNLQSSILKKSGICYIEYFLPLVIGGNTAQDIQLRKLAESPGIELPKEGKNHFYFLQLGSLISEIFKHIDTQPLTGSCSLFLYSDYSTLEQLLKKYYGSSGKYKDSAYNNAYNIPLSQVILHLIMKFIKSIGAIIYYTIKRGCIQKTQSIDSSVILRIGPDTSRFFSMDFFPPNKITSVRLLKK